MLRQGGPRSSLRAPSTLRSAWRAYQGHDRNFLSDDQTSCMIVPPWRDFLRELPIEHPGSRKCWSCSVGTFKFGCSIAQTAHKVGNSCGISESLRRRRLLLQVPSETKKFVHKDEEVAAGVLGCFLSAALLSVSTVSLAFIAECPCPRCSVMLPCSCADDVDEVLRQVRQKTTTTFETITSAKALSVAHESVEQRGERAQQGQHLRLDARVVLDELRSSSCRPPLNFSCVFSRGVRRRVHGRSAASACAACAACAAVSGGQRRRRRVGSGRREARGASAGGCGKCCEEVVFGVCGSLNPAVRVFPRSLAAPQ